MNGEIYTRADLERMRNWVGTFRQVVCVASPRDHVVCLLKKPDKGFWWKAPGRTFVEEANLGKMQAAIDAGRLVLVLGRLPRGVKQVERPRYAAAAHPHSESRSKGRAKRVKVAI